MVHSRETLTAKEQAAQDAFIEGLKIARRKTKRPLIVALVGLIGSGKSSIARDMASRIGATIIEADAIRVELRQRNETYDNARAIGENAAIKVIQGGGNVILDSDFVDDKKRASLREKARKIGARLVLIRVICDMDVTIGRILSETYPRDSFFGGASTKWTGPAKHRGAIIKLREMHRRTPHHYTWMEAGGGQWKLKKLPFTVFATIDTTDPESWPRALERCIKQLFA